MKGYKLFFRNVHTKGVWSRHNFLFENKKDIDTTKSMIRGISKGVKTQFRVSEVKYPLMDTKPVYTGGGRTYRVFTDTKR